MDLFTQIPDYAAAVEREAALREEAFIDGCTPLCGVRVYALTLRRFVILSGIGSPFLCGGTPTPEQIIIFLWIQSRPLGVLTSSSREQRRFAARLGKLDYADTVGAIREWVATELQDSPSSVVGPRRAHFASWAAAMVHQIAIEYHWSEAEILDMPLARLFQYGRIIRRRYDPKAMLFNPSDKVKGDWLRERSKESQP